MMTCDRASSPHLHVSTPYAPLIDCLGQTIIHTLHITTGWQRRARTSSTVGGMLQGGHQQMPPSPGIIGLSWVLSRPSFDHNWLGYPRFGYFTNLLFPSLAAVFTTGLVLHHAVFLTNGRQIVAKRWAIGSNIIWQIFWFPLLFSIDRFLYI